MKRMTQTLGALALALGLTVGPSAHAASIVARDVAHMTKHADAVIRGEVVEQQVELDLQGLPWTRTTLRVEQAYKGAVGATLDVWQRGGVMPDGSVVRIDGDLELAVGERAVVFLSEDADHGGRFVSFLLGWSAFELTGEGPLASLRRSAADLEAHEVDAQGVIAPPGKSLRAKPPVVLSDLEARIAAAMEASR